MTKLRTKSDVRNEAKCHRAELSAVTCELLAALLRSQITTWITQIPQSVERLFIFAALKGEPDLLPLLHDLPGLHFALPRILNKYEMEFRDYHKGSVLIPGPLGIREPGPQTPIVHPGPKDVIFVPALALSTSGQRIGHGAGYYDRYLAAHRAGAILVGVCYGEAVYPAGTWQDEPHDQRVQYLATDREILSLTPSKTAELSKV